MKKLFMIVVVSVCAIVGVFAEDVQAVNSVETMMIISDLIEEDFDGNKSLIMDNAKLLNDMQRKDLFDSKKSSTVGPFCLNLFVGFGIGSFVQGDMLGGGIGLGADLTGLTLTIVGLTKIIKTGNDAAQQTTLNDEQKKDIKSGLTLSLIGGGVYLVSKIFQSIKPWTYANSFNDELKDALGVYAINFDVMPSFNIATNSPAVTASVSIEL